MPDNVDLLNPTDLQSNYVHQVYQTIKAYEPPLIVLGEALQNALDAVKLADSNHHKIQVTIDFDESRVSVEDSGVGFPNDPSLLYLGGTQKAGQRLFGLIGVGIKVVLFSSESFLLKAVTDNGAHYIEIHDAHRFHEGNPPAIEVPSPLSADDSPLDHQGTKLEYTFPVSETQDVLKATVDLMIEKCLPAGVNSDFGKTLKSGVDAGRYPSRFAGLFEAFLRRYTYCGDVLRCIGQNANKEISLTLEIKCSDPAARLGPGAAELFDEKSEVRHSFEPKYLLVEDTLDYCPSPKPGMFSDRLGDGGQALQLTAKGFNVQKYASPDEYETLLKNSAGSLPRDIEEYRERLFSKLNGIILVVGRIPHFDEYLPGGSKRSISANGIVTGHEVEFTKGQNQQYVRCFDIVLDVDAELNYGKTSLTDRHLVNRIKRFLNDAYARSIQNAAAKFVGRVTPPETEHDIFLERQDLGVSGFAIQKVPRDENDVIALFFELVGRGVINNYRFFGLSQSDTYDARAAIKREADDETVFHPERDADLRVIEFKLDAASIVRDLERHQKEAKEMDLLIAWDEAETTSQQFAFVDIEHSAASKYSPSRVFPQAQRCLQDARTGAEVQVLLLKRVLEELATNE